MAVRPLPPGRIRGLLRPGLAGLALAAAAGCALLSSGKGSATTETAEVTRGTYSDIVEIRGQVEPVRSTYVSAPYGAGELQIVKMASNGAAVKAGDVVAEFDAVTLGRTIQEKQGELRSARAALEQNGAQSQITLEERKAAVAKAEFDVERARLSLGEIGLVSEIDAERARLGLADAEQRLHEARASLASAEANARSDREARERAVDKVLAELELAQRQVTALYVTAPTDGTVNILRNPRSSNPLGGASQEFRMGDRAYPGAMILELPDLSSVFLTARIDEADRGRLDVGQTAVIRLDAIADRDYEAVVDDISFLARIDFNSGWPPLKQFDLTLAIVDPDDRLRPGMSAAARITVGELEDALLIPTAALFYEEGRTVVYREASRSFDAVPVEVVRRGREQAAVSGSLTEGDRLSLVRPGSSAQEEEP